MGNYSYDAAGKLIVYLVASGKNDFSGTYMSGNSTALLGGWLMLL